MVKIAMYKKDNGALLVIWKTPKGNLVGEVFNNGVEKRGEWDSRTTFCGATEYRVCEYFGFSTSNSIAYWKRWPSLTYRL
jgi:hypothetical protein